MITGVTAAAGTYAGGAVLRVYVAISAPVRLLDAAQPPLLFTNAGPAIYNPAGSTSQNLRFELTPQSGISANPLAVISLNPGAGRTDATGNPLVLGGAAVSLPGVIIVAVLPKEATVLANAGLYGAAAEIEVLLGLSKPCVVVGTLTLATSEGVAAADPAQTTANQLAFRVAVPAGQVPGSLQVDALIWPQVRASRTYRGSRSGRGLRRRAAARSPARWHGSRGH